MENFPREMGCQREGSRDNDQQRSAGQGCVRYLAGRQIEWRRMFDVGLAVPARASVANAVALVAEGGVVDFTPRAELQRLHRNRTTSCFAVGPAWT